MPSSATTSASASCSLASRPFRSRCRTCSCCPICPRRIECFDISHIQGAETVASMVVWEDGAMKKSDYRKFQVKTVDGVDDFASMREVVTRRYSRVIEEKRTMPCLILDRRRPRPVARRRGSARRARPHHASRSPRSPSAKKSSTSTGRKTSPSCWTAARRCCISSRRSATRSHRFAITYHRKRREMRDRDSELLTIPGVGPRTRPGCWNTSAACAAWNRRVWKRLPPSCPEKPRKVSMVIFMLRRWRICCRFFPMVAHQMVLVDAFLAS